MVVIYLMFLSLLASAECIPVPGNELQGSILRSSQPDVLLKTKETPEVKAISADELNLPSDQPSSDEILEEDESQAPRVATFERLPAYYQLDSRAFSDYDDQPMYAPNDPVYDLEAAASEFHPEQVYGDSEPQRDLNIQPLPIYVLRNVRSFLASKVALTEDSLTSGANTVEEKQHPELRQKRDVVFDSLPTYLIRVSRAAQRGDYGRGRPRPRYYPLFRPRAEYTNSRRPLEIVY